MKNNKFVIFITLCIVVFSAIIFFYKKQSHHIQATSVDDSKVESRKMKKKDIKTREASFVDKFAGDKEETVLDRLKQAEEEWLVELNDFFSQTESFTFNDYLQLREGYYEDYLKAFEEFNDAVNGKKYQPTEESLKMNKIKKQYHKLLLEKIGEENYKKFLKLKDEFNERKFYSQDNKYYQPMDF